MKRIFLLFCGWLVLINAADLYAEFAGFGNLSVKNGLSHNMVSCVLKDSRGFVWVGTKNGLNRFDGYVIRPYPPDSQCSGTGLHHGYISGLVEDLDNRIWISSLGGGLTCYDPESGRISSFRHVPGDPASISSNRISVIRLDKNGGLWLGCFNGSVNLLKRSARSFKRIQLQSESDLKQSGAIITDICSYSNNEVWISTYGRGIFRYLKKDDRVEPIDMPGFKKSDPVKVSCIIQGRNQNMWVGTLNGGLLQYQVKQKTWQEIELPDRFNCPGDRNLEITALARDPDNVIWIGTGNRGLIKYNPRNKKCMHFLHSNRNHVSVSSNRITFLLNDEFNTLWVGTAGGGVSYSLYEGLLRRGVPGQSRDGCNTVYCMLQTGSKEIMMGSGDGCVYIYSFFGNKLIPVPGARKKTKVSGHAITSICGSATGEVFLGTWGDGIWKLDPETNRVKKINPVLKHSRNGRIIFVRKIFPGCKNEIVVLTLKQGILKINLQENLSAEEIKIPEQMGDLISGSMSAAAAVNGVIWVANHSSRALLKIDREAHRTEAVRTGDYPGPARISGRILCLSPGQGGIMWMGTEKGLAAFNAHTGETISVGNTRWFADKRIINIIEYSAGRLLVGTAGEFYFFEPGTGRCRVLAPGIVHYGHEYISGSVLCCSGAVLFGNSCGFDYCFPGNIGPENGVLPMAFTELKKGGKAVHLTPPLYVRKEIALNCSMENTSICFSLLNYPERMNLEYAYRIVPGDLCWKDIGADHEIFLPVLSSGTYKLQVKGADLKNSFRTQIIEMQLNVSDHSFLNLGIILFVSVLLALVYISSLMLRQNRAILTRKSLKISAIAHTCQLSKREKEVLDLLVRGLSNREIEKKLYISIKTVKGHVYHIYKKTGVKNRVQLLHKIDGAAPLKKNKKNQFPGFS